MRSKQGEAGSLVHVRNITLWLSVGNKPEQARLEIGSPTRKQAKKGPRRSGKGQTGGLRTKLFRWQNQWELVIGKYSW